MKSVAHVHIRYNLNFTPKSILSKALLFNTQPSRQELVYPIIAKIKWLLGNSKMKQTKFIHQVVERIKADNTVIGLAAAGSFITNEIDDFSDVDLVLVTRESVAPNLSKMENYARTFGNYISGFTGEHVGEKRVLICLYDNPLLHVDIKS